MSSRSLPLALLVTSLLGASLVGACTPGGTSQCPCFPCTDAVVLSVFDSASGDGVATFVVEAIVNGVEEGEPAGCRLDERTGNSCGFGTATGVYHLIVTAPGYQTRETVVRQADPGGAAVCCEACLNPREIQLELDPL